jgi:hypothetical protein
MKKFLLLISYFLIAKFTFSQVPVLQFQKSLGGSDQDRGTCIATLPNNQYIVAGEAVSWDGDLNGNHGGLDLWLVKLDSSFNVVWQKALGGSYQESASAIYQTDDGGFIIGGTASSDNGDVVGLHIDFFPEGDYWIIKTDSSGNIEWQKCLGGTEEDYCNDLHQTSDSGFIVIGEASSNDGDITGHYGCNGCYEDYWIVKLDKFGSIQWEKSYGGSSYDFGYGIIQTTDGGYIACGATTSSDSDVTFNHGSYDAWIIRLDISGNLLWQKSLGGSQDEVASKILQTNDGGFIFVGNTRSIDGDVIGNHGDLDVWIFKLDSNGGIQWQKCLGGSGPDLGWDIQLTDGGYLISGEADSFDGDVTGSHGLGDFWIVKIDTFGNIVWQKSLGGSGTESANEIRSTSDSGLVVIGTSFSNDGDVTGNHGGLCGNTCDDYWIVKLSNASVSIPEIQDNIPMSYQIQNDQLQIKLYSTKVQTSYFSLFDIDGRILLNQQITIASGINQEKIYIGGFSPGIYIFQMYEDEHLINTKVLIK